MTTHTAETMRSPGRRLRARALAMATVLAFIGAACAPPPGGGGDIDVPFGPVTVPLPPIGTTPPAQTVNLLGICDASYQPPSFTIDNATATIPGIRINPDSATVSVPNVSVNIPAATIALPSVSLSCFGITLSTAVNLNVPASAQVQSATINLQTGVLTLSNPNFTITGVGLSLPGIGGLVIPLPPLTIPLPTITLPLDDLL